MYRVPGRSAMVVTILTLASCSSDDSSPINGNSNGANDTISIFGTWSTDCYSLANIDSYFLETVVFREQTIDTTLGEYQDAACTIRDLSRQEDETDSGVYTLGSSVITSSGLSATRIDLNYGDFLFKTIVYRSESILYVGDTEAEEDSEGRPTAIDFTIPYRLQ